MKFGAPWHVKGVHPEARDSAREAARRAGLSVGDWLNSVILDSAQDDGHHGDHPQHSGQQAYQDPYAPPSHRAPPRRAPQQQYYQPQHQPQPQYQPPYQPAYQPPQYAYDPVAEQVAAINQQLAGLTQGFETLVRTTSVSRSPWPEQDATSKRLADAIARLDQRVEQLAQEGRNASKALERRVESFDRALSSLGRAQMPPPESWESPMERAMAQIHQRQSELEGGHFPGRQTTPPPRAYDDFSAVHDKLRTITEQIDTLGSTHVQSAINALRNDLADIARTLTEASPRRAIEALEGEVRVLASRLDMRGRDGSVVNLAKVEQGLAEVRDTLRALTPAENLSGVVDAIRAVSQRLDQIAVGAADPSAVHQLEGAIAGLREILSHVASRDGLAALTEEVRALASRIDNMPAPSARDNEILRTLEQRIATIADAIEQVRAAGTSQTAGPDIDAMVRTLGDRIERLHAAGNDHPAFAQLEDRISHLVRKLDASEARLGNLDAIERGMKELLAYLADTRRERPQPTEQTIQRDIRRAEQSIEAAHGTIGDVVDRLAQIETGMRTAGPAAAYADRPAAPVSAPPQRPAAEAPAVAYQHMPVVQSPPIQAPQPHVHAVAASAPPPAQARAPEPPRPPQVARPAVAQVRPTADGTLPYDFPLEPGSGKPRPGMAAPAPGAIGSVAAMGSPAERIARSKAAIAPAKAPPTDAEQKSNFILAARRAAQFAAETQPAANHEVMPELDVEPATPSLGSRLGRFVKPVLIGVSVIVLLAAAIHMGMNYFLGGEAAVEVPKSQSRAPAPAPAPAATRVSPAMSPNSLVDLGGPSNTLQGGSGVLPPPPATPVPAAPVAATPIPQVTPVAPVANTPPPAAPNPASTSAPKTIDAPAEKPTTPPAAINLAPPAADVTGSVPTRKLSLTPPPAGLFPVPMAARSMTVPSTIGSKALVAAAEADDPAAAYEVAVRYIEGRGVPVSLEEASVWFERAARKGMTQAMFRLGGLYEKGTGVKKDLNRARSLYGEAANRGHAKAMHNLAVLYAEGIDGKPDYSTAVRWFHMAASRGVADSQFNLGVLYARGIGMEQNLAESYRWFSLAAKSGDNDAAQKRDDVAKRLDQQTITAVNANVQKWTAEAQPADAIAVYAPAGGWDAGATPPPKAKNKRAQAGHTRAL